MQERWKERNARAVAFLPILRCRAFTHSFIPDEKLPHRPMAAPTGVCAAPLLVWIRTELAEAVALLPVSS